MKSTAKNITVTAMGIALFVAMSLCIQVPVFENYYLCLGYVAMTAYCYIVGTISGTLVGTMGVVLYCVLTGGLNGMPGWALGNLVIGIVMGITFKYLKKLKKTWLEFIISSIIIIIVTAFAMLIIKSSIEYLLYLEPFVFRLAKNVYAFVADAIIIIVSIPISRTLEPHVKKLISK